MEPKYEMGDIVELKNGNIVIINWVHAGTHGIWYEVTPSLAKEDFIVNKCKTIPDLGEVYCKDCKHCDLENDEYLEGCPYNYAGRHDSEIYYILKPSVNSNYNDNYPLSDKQPPPNCNCFEPKEAK